MPSRPTTEHAREGPPAGGAVRGAVLRLTPQSAEDIVALFESGRGTDVDSDSVQLLERFFLENGESELSRRYEEALARSLKKM